MDSIHLPNAIALPNAFGAPGTPLPPGQVVQALVLALIESDVFRLQLPQAVVDVRSDVPLTPGSTITLAVKGSGPSAKLVIYSDVSSNPAQAGQRAAPSPAGQRVAPSLTVQAAPSLAGRQPIGEAVVIARMPAGQAVAPAPGRTSAEPAVVRDAPPIAPAPPSRQPEMPRVVTPEQAVGEAVRTAAPRQTGLAPLFANVEQVVAPADVIGRDVRAPLSADAEPVTQAPQVLGKPVPAPVRAAAADVLSLRVPLDETLTAADVKQAFVRSGVLFESRLAAVKTAPPADAEILTPAADNDLKAALLVFRQVLKMWSASEPLPGRPAAAATPVATTPDAAARPSPPSPPSATDTPIRPLANVLAGAPEELIPNAPLSPEQATTLAKTVATALTARDAPPAQPSSANSGPPPPYRSAPLAAQAATAPSIALDAAPHEIADKLIAQTDGALARQTLLQVASLPDQPDMPRAEASQRWTFEIPFATPQGTSVAQFEVSRDGRAPQADPQARTWRARFSLDVEPMGPVHALVALSGPRASVTLWAERATSASRLQDSAPLLSEALRAAELEPADFQLRVGAPPAVRQATPGRFMDRAT